MLSISNSLIESISALSEEGSLSINKYYEIFNRVYESECTETGDHIELNTIRAQFSRFLEDLGYCEFNWEDRSLNVCPPTLIRLPSPGLTKVMLTGARSKELLRELNTFVGTNENIIKMERIPQKISGTPFPDTVLFEGISKKDFEGINSIETCRLKFDLDIPFSWKLANFSGTIEEANKEINYRPMKEPNWPRKVFSSEQLRFRELRETPSDNYLASYQNPLDNQFRHFLWDKGEAAEVDRDWGRYLILSFENVNVLLYDHYNFLFGVPVTAPLPGLLGRSIALCGGVLPQKIGLSRQGRYTPQFYYYVYPNVTPEIAKLVARKLSQGLKYQNFSNIFEVA